MTDTRASQRPHSSLYAELVQVDITSSGMSVHLCLRAGSATRTANMFLNASGASLHSEILSRSPLCSSGAIMVSTFSASLANALSDASRGRASESVLAAIHAKG